METFRGSYQATVDDKGRLKLPARLKGQLEEWYGSRVFVTSLGPLELRVYPLSVWEELERRFLARPSLDPLVQRLLEHANYGQEDEVDSQGRVLVPALLRDVLGVNGEVVVSGRGRFLAVVARDRAQAELATPFTNEELAALAALEQ
ncbi:MAG: division/cell wall cluster transcriptional repressor MraZ [Thermoanaerobaculaceae bacterium]|jgi:MraZ protein